MVVFGVVGVGPLEESSPQADRLVPREALEGLLAGEGVADCGAACGFFCEGLVGIGTHVEVFVGGVEVLSDGMGWG